MITKAGGEGLDLKEVRNVILFEKGWNVAGEEQVIGRAVRLKSHIGLDDEKDKLVTVYHLVVVKPTGSKFMTIDSNKKIELPYINRQLTTVNKTYNVNPKDYLSEFSKFVKEITINEEYALPALERSPTGEKYDSYGAEVFMFANGLYKNLSIMKLRNLLKEISISEENIFDPFQPEGNQS